MPEDRLGFWPDAVIGEATRLLLFRGIFRGVTSGLSRTGSTWAVRPLAPRQPGREGAKEPAAGSAPLLTLFGFLSVFPPPCAIRLTLSPKEVIAAVGLLCWDADGGLALSPRANSAGLTCDDFPVSLLVCSPVMASQRTSPFCWLCRCVASRSFECASRRAASDCFRRARRIMGMLDRDCGPSPECCPCGLALALLAVLWGA